MSSQEVRVRFAPSPTGPLHIGGVRTALYNYLFAKKNSGTFVLRIEDTDQSRYVPGAEDYIVESLNWCGIPFDEGPGKEGDFGPYRQSERKTSYRKYAEMLINSGHAYYAFDTPEALEKHRRAHEANGKTFIYNWHNRLELDNSLSLSEKAAAKRLEDNTPYVIRFKVPANEQLELNDEIRGDMVVNTKELDDKVLFKSDGMPTYHLANIVDDHLMAISHVIRGEEWLPSLPLHLLLYRALNFEPPRFAHLPLILKPQGKGKLSKRDGAKMGFPVFPLEWKDPVSGEVSKGYREEGYFPEAVVNMLALLGWNQGSGTEKEIYSLQELNKAFSLEHISKGGSKFDPEKTKWFQHHYMQQRSSQELTTPFLELLTEKGVTTTPEYAKSVIRLIKERTTFLEDFWDKGNFFFVAPEKYDEKAFKKAWKADTTQILDQVKEIFDRVEPFDAKLIRHQLKQWIESQGIGFGKVMQPFRISLVGAMQGPDVFEIAELLGREETIRRITAAQEHN